MDALADARRISWLADGDDGARCLVAEDEVAVDGEAAGALPCR